MNMNIDTIAAISTGLTNSGIGIVRISGEDAFRIIDKIYKPVRGTKKISNQKSHTIHYGYIIDKEEIIDEVIILKMDGPNSYTKEDTIEIDCHGGVLVTKKVLETVISYGARLAEPGEFTKRAFLNGRIDLSQAESVMDLIQAKNEFAVKNSIHQLSGSIKNKISALREQIIYEIAYIESALDDPEHYEIEHYGEILLPKIHEIENNIEVLLKTADNGSLLKEGINTVILGKPNAGKSSLLNVLIGKEKAIVTEIEGTTRDALEEQINLNGITLNIIDTAGIRNTQDVVEKIGVHRAKEYAKEADLIIYVVDSSRQLDQNDYEIMDLIQDKKGIILLNKSDLNQVIQEDEIKKHLNKVIIPISAKQNSGIERLEEEIKNMFFQGKITFNDEVFITNVRHKSLLRDANESLKMVASSINSGMPEDFYSIDLMNAYEGLGKIIGESVEEDLVNEIFHKFCMGK